MAKDNLPQANKLKEGKEKKSSNEEEVLPVDGQKKQAIVKKGHEKAKSFPKKKEIEREKHQIDLTGLIFGRVATQVALLLSGKRKVTYLPYVDCGDWVTVYNLKRIKFKGNRKMEDKIYYHYSGYPGGIKSIQLKDAIKQDFPKVFRRAVYQMLPKNKLRKKAIIRLKILEGEIKNK